MIGHYLWFILLLRHALEENPLNLMEEGNTLSEKCYSYPASFLSSHLFSEQPDNSYNAK